MTPNDCIEWDIIPLTAYALTPTVRAEHQSARMSKNYKRRLIPVWHRMLYSCTHMALVGVKGLKRSQVLANHDAKQCVHVHLMYLLQQMIFSSDVTELKDLCICIDICQCDCPYLCVYFCTV